MQTVGAEQAPRSAVEHEAGPYRKWKRGGRVLHKTFHGGSRLVVAAAAKQRPVELKDVQNSQLDRHFLRVLLLDMQQRLGIMHHSAQPHAQQA